MTSEQAVAETRELTMEEIIQDISSIVGMYSGYRASREEWTVL
jgi:hypothetical protein